MNYYFPKALLQTGWADDVMLEIDSTTRLISKVHQGVDIDGTQPSQRFNAIAIPSFTNGHSHAFQRAFTGLSEFRTGQHDSFWTWRKLMYQFLESLSPDQMYTIAKRLYRGMLECGYSAVCEFHYVHHSPNGQPYDDRAIMANSLIQAALDVGLSICMLPVLYQRSGFEDGPLDGAQKRFYNDTEGFLDLCRKLQTEWKGEGNVSLGVALHSLRAVRMEVIKQVIEEIRTVSPLAPIHMHIAEQTQEVMDCVSVTRRRPVEYLLEHCELDSHWCLIHATHVNEEENRSIATSGATVCVCPTTEANLGDGIFSAEQYLLDYSGALAIGSDSNLCLNPFSELRLLEYGQRLKKHRRAVLSTSELSTGRFLCNQSWASASSISNFATGVIAVGHRVDLMLLDPEQFAISSFSQFPDRYLDFCLVDEQAWGTRCLTGMIVNGEPIQFGH